MDSASIRSFLEAWQKEAPGERAVILLSSTGGDVGEAMEIGRAIRRARAEVNVMSDDNCASACALVFCGGTYRYMHGRLGIHKPYSTSVGQKSFEQAQREHDALQISVKAYLKEMNVSERFYEAMLAVPAQSIRWLNQAELAQLGVPEVDPVEEEVWEAGVAKLLGISRQELLARLARMTKDCGAFLRDGPAEKYAECRKRYIGNH